MNFTKRENRLVKNANEKYYLAPLRLHFLLLKRSCDFRGFASFLYFKKKKPKALGVV